MGTKIIVSKKSGFCYGVKKAIEMAESISGRNKERIYTLGPLIHNRYEVKRLERLGVKSVSSIRRLKKGILLIRTHGLTKGIMDELKTKDLSLIDATCPFVKRVQRLVETLSKEGYSVIIIGEKNHPETIGLVSYSLGPVQVVNSAVEIKKLKMDEPIAVVSQTTQSVGAFKALVDEIKRRFSRVKIFNTICNAASERQKETEGLAGRVDLMIIVGGKNSANTTRLKDISSKYVRTYHIESAEELRKTWFRGAGLTGISAGASTPDWLIKGVISRINMMQGCKPAR